MGAMAPTLFENMPIGTHTFCEESYEFHWDLRHKSSNRQQDLTIMGLAPTLSNFQREPWKGRKDRKERMGKKFFPNHDLIAFF